MSSERTRAVLTARLNAAQITYAAQDKQYKAALARRDSSASILCLRRRRAAERLTAAEIEAREAGII